MDASRKKPWTASGSRRSAPTRAAPRRASPSTLAPSRHASTASLQRHGAPPSSGTQIGREDARAAGGPRRLVQDLVQPLHLADEDADVVVRAGAPRAGGQPLRQRRVARSAGRCQRPAPRRRASARPARRGRPCRMSSSPSASVATIGLPVASASNAVSGVPSHSDGNTTMSSALRTAATSRWKPLKTNRSPSCSAAACALSGALSSPSPTMKNRALGMRRQHRRRGLDQVLVALRRHQPRHRADGRSRRRACRAAAGRGDLVGASAAARTRRAARPDRPRWSARPASAAPES